MTNDIIFVTNIQKMKNYPVDEEYPDSLSLAAESSAEYMIYYSRKGLDMTYLSNLISRLSLSLKETAQILHISLRTLQRYGKTDTLDKDISSKLLYLAKLEGIGLQIFDSQESFNTWLRTPAPSLNNHTPLSYLDTPFGFELVEQTLGRMAHGIFA